MLSLILVAFVTGVNVPYLFFRNPFQFLEVVYGEVYLAGNLLWVLILLLLLFVTNLDKPLLRRLNLFYEEEKDLTK